MSAATSSEKQSNMEAETSDRWTDLRVQMHKAIDDRNYPLARQCLEKASHLRLWLHPSTGESAMHRAVTQKSFCIYALMDLNRCQFKDEEERERLYPLDRVHNSELLRQVQAASKDNDTHVRHIRNAIQSRNAVFREKIGEMIHELNKDELLRTIMRVVGHCDHLKIIVDSEKEDVQNKTGCFTGGKLFGLTLYQREVIFLGGKREGESSEEASDAEVMGTFCHELCHLALHTVYGNDGRPYCSTDIAKKRRYNQIIENMKKDLKDLDPIVRDAFDRDTETELIVRIPHIIAKRVSSGDRSATIDSRISELFHFFNSEVILDMIKYIKDAPPGVDVKKIAAENARLGKAFRTENLQVAFKNPLQHQELEDIPLLILTSPDFRFLEILVHDAIKSAGLPYLFFDVTQWDKKLVDVLCENKCHFLLIACNRKETLPEILQVLSELSHTAGTRVILLVQERDKDHFLKEVRKNAFFEKRHRAVYEDRAHLGNVTEECMDTVRKQSYLRFQGTDYTILLEEVVDLEAFSTHVDGTAFLALCQSKYLNVGPFLDEQGKPVSEYYVKRRIRIQVPFDAAKLHEADREEFFVFTGCSGHTIKQYLPSNRSVIPCSSAQSLPYYFETQGEKFILCYDFEKYEFITTSECFLKKNIYLLQYSQKEKAWDWSSLQIPENHFPFRELQIRDEDYLLTPMNDKVVFICGAPGAGKSTLASRLSKQLKERENNRWVMHVNLPERIATLNIRADVEKIQEFAVLCGVKTEGLEFFLFQKSLQTGALLKIEIIFDALDEISVKWREYILDIVQSLRETRVSRIYILSRTELARSIRNKLCVDPIELLPFSDKDLIPFLKGYWKANGARDISDAELHSAATKTLHYYMGAMKQNQEILKIPILIGMIAESELLHEKAAGNITRCGNLFEIYRMFADYRYNIYAKEKIGADTSSPTVASQRENEKREMEFYRDLGLLGVSDTLTLDEQIILLTAEEKKDLKPHGRLMKDVTECRVGYGLLDGIVNSRPRFIHRTFAEFFTARFLYRKIRDVGNHDLMIFVLSMYKRMPFNPLVYFLDSFPAASITLHSTVINGGTPSEVVQDVRVLDEFDRTIVHVAVLYANADVLRKLPISDAMRCKDVFGMTRLMYVTKLEEWEKLDVFCDLLSNENIEWAKEIPEVIETVKKGIFHYWSALYRAVSDNLYSLLKVLLNKCCRKRTKWYQWKNPRLVNLDTVKSEDKRTPLFYAKSVGVVKLLLLYCDIRAVDEYYGTLLHNAVLESYPFEVVEFYFLRLPVAYSTLDKGIRRGYPDVVKLLLLRSQMLRTGVDGLETMENEIRECKRDIIDLVLPNSSIAHEGYVAVTNYLLGWLFNCVPKGEIVGSIYHSPKKMRQIREHLYKRYTYQEQFEAIFPYLNIDDESHFTDCFTRGHFLQNQRSLVPLKQILLRFDVSSTGGHGWSSLYRCAKWGSVDEMKLLLPNSDASMREEFVAHPPVICPEEHEMTQAVLWWSIKDEHWR